MDTTGSWYLPGQHSTIAGEVDALFDFMLVASTILFVIVCGLSVYFVVRYRRRRTVLEPTYGKDHNLTLEILWTVIPIILVGIVFVWGFTTYLKMNVVPANAMEIKVTGQKWFWSFDYPQTEGVTSVNELVVPVDKPVRLLMSSQDVIHSLFIPNFRIKMDVLPNRYSVTWFEATEIGEYNLFCTEFCGRSHSEMIGKVRVLSQLDYDKWLEESEGAGEGMSQEDYGAKLYVSKACVTCHSIDGSVGTGPSFLNKFGGIEQLRDGSSLTIDENYIRESILSPNAKVVAGFAPVMPTYQGLLKDAQIDALVAYIKSLGQEASNTSNE